MLFLSLLIEIWAVLAARLVKVGFLRVSGSWVVCVSCLHSMSRILRCLCWFWCLHVGDVVLGLCRVMYGTYLALLVYLLLFMVFIVFILLFLVVYIDVCYAVVLVYILLGFGGVFWCFRIFCDVLLLYVYCTWCSFILHCSMSIYPHKAECAFALERTLGFAQWNQGIYCIECVNWAHMTMDTASAHTNDGVGNAREVLYVSRAFSTYHHISIAHHYLNTGRKSEGGI